MKTLNVKQALKQGYTQAVQKGVDWGHLEDIVELNEVDFKNNEWVLVDKEDRHFVIDADTIKDFVLDHIYDMEDQIGCDTGQFRDTLKDFDFESLAAPLNEKLKGYGYRQSVGIELILK